MKHFQTIPNEAEKASIFPGEEAKATPRIYKPEHNCWKTDRADKASLLIDCANYYRALHHAISNARHSIFILGWDVDGRIELLRGDESDHERMPVSLFELIKLKAEENPELKVYINRWNHSIFFAREREPFSDWKWRIRTPENVHYCADYNVPFTACHHQKVVVVDDAIAFCGGMDIALGRWDRRQHHTRTRERVDPGGFLDFFRKRPYTPHHDIQMVMTGPAVKILSELVRERWERGAHFCAIATDMTNPARTDLWPEHVTPDFENIELAVARSLPKTKKLPTVHEIYHMYLDEIAQAERFIYIENQYLACLDIARALNKRMKEKPELRVLAVSCDHPNGLMEHKAMWTARVIFCDMVREGIDPSRFVVTYPVSKENGTEETIHIHSKIMIIDDRLLHVGSSNLNNRSMGFDTECDVILQDPNGHENFASLRNNLIREHTGREEKDIADMIDSFATLPQLLEFQENSRQHLREIDNDPYRKDFLTHFAKKLGDPKEAHILANFPVRQTLVLCLILGILGLLAWFYVRPVLPEEFRALFTQESFLNFMENARGSPWSPIIIIAVYVLGGAIFFPVTVLNLTSAVVFGPMYGFFYAFLGSLSSAAVAYFSGFLLGKQISHLFKPAIAKVNDYTDRGGIVGMTMVRFIPIAPFTLVNIIFGISRANFFIYLLATFFGLLPGVAAKALFGGALGELFSNPEPKIVFYAAGCLVLWLLIIWGTHRFFQHYKKKRAS